MLTDRFGWPAPVEALSGNGFYLLYRINLPNDNDSAQLVAAEQAVNDHSATAREYQDQCRAEGDDFGVQYADGNLLLMRAGSDTRRRLVAQVVERLKKEPPLPTCA